MTALSIFHNLSKNYIVFLQTRFSELFLPEYNTYNFLQFFLFGKTAGYKNKLSHNMSKCADHYSKPADIQTNCAELLSNRADFSGKPVYSFSKSANYFSKYADYFGKRADILSKCAEYFGKRTDNLRKCADYFSKRPDILRKHVEYFGIRAEILGKCAEYYSKCADYFGSYANKTGMNAGYFRISYNISRKYSKHFRKPVSIDIKGSFRRIGYENFSGSIKSLSSKKRDLFDILLRSYIIFNLTFRIIPILYKCITVNYIKNIFNFNFQILIHIGRYFNTSDPNKFPRAPPQSILS